MPIEIKIPALGESITEVQIGEWLKAEGDVVAQDENILIIESEKASVELPAPAAGRLAKILTPKGQPAKVGDTVAYLEAGAKETAAKAEAGSKNEQAPPATPAKPPAAEPAAQPASETQAARPSEPRVMPAAARLLAEHKLEPGQIKATGPGGRIVKEDVVRKIEAGQDQTGVPGSPVPATGSREEETVPMSPLRRTVARRLVEAQHNAALLTTINEINMFAVMALRKECGEVFQQKHGVKLGFMSFFVKSVIEALKQIPQLNAEVRGTEIVYHNYYDVGIAIGSGKGLVVPVVRNAERLSFAAIEKTIADFARRAQENKLKPDELQGGTFTISNGGVYGSLLSTPIVNPPQSGVLGMHAIQERPVAIEGSVVIRPMMYVALTYDHRIVDGREAVTFLRRVKDLIEKPARMLLEA
jgi:2-oxoglutarate dehydrogenase E2 component (dihydrolipoamide succinyltransferase)